MARWYLVDNNRTLELRETSEGDLEQRFHFVIHRKQKIPINSVPSDQLGQTRTLLDYFIGGAFFQFQATNRTYLCIQDGEQPETEFSCLRIRQQVWEHFSPWEDGPDLGDGTP